MHRQARAWLFRSFGPVAILAASLAPLGCGYPTARPENFALLASLRTALSAKNEEWLRMNEEKILARHQAGEMGDDEFATFTRIIAQARGGDWAGAEKATLRFQRAQQPTPEQIEANRRRRGES